MQGKKGSISAKWLPKEAVWNLNWVTHALVNKTTQEEHAKRVPMPKSMRLAGTEE